MSNTQKNPEEKPPSELVTYLLPKSSSNKKTLVLDLDETLVHSQFQPFDVPSDIILKIELENELHDIHVMVRPGVSEFLKNMGKIYEIVIFTASVSKYADPLLDIIDKEKNCKFRLFREHCTPINTCYVKEIKKLGRELKNVIIVDNSPMSYALNPENGLPINTWFDDKTDRELYNISSILEFLSFVPDVRNYINQFIVNDEISYTNVINVFDKGLIFSFFSFGFILFNVIFFFILLLLIIFLFSLDLNLVFELFLLNIFLGFFLFSSFISVLFIFIL